MQIEIYFASNQTTNNHLWLYVGSCWK